MLGRSDNDGHKGMQARDGLGRTGALEPGDNCPGSSSQVATLALPNDLKILRLVLYPSRRTAETRLVRAFAFKHLAEEDILRPSAAAESQC